jgi:hypothetical protein
MEPPSQAKGKVGPDRTVATPELLQSGAIAASVKIATGTLDTPKRCGTWGIQLSSTT